MDFVPFEIAKQLKEKGFREPCFGWYHPSGVCIYGYLTLLIANQSDCRGCDYDDLLESHNDDKHIDTPTISQVLQWLREEKKIWICVNPGPKGFNISIYNDVEQYYNNICDDWLFDYTLRKELYCYKTYEEAALAGIEYVLDNLI